MQLIGHCYYVQHFNDSYSRTGTLWKWHYKATLINAGNYLYDLLPLYWTQPGQGWKHG